MDKIPYSAFNLRIKSICPNPNWSRTWESQSKGFFVPKRIFSGLNVSFLLCFVKKLVKFWGVFVKFWGVFVKSNLVFSFP